jgi:hypothetical protein
MITVREFTRIERKLDLQTRDTGDRIAVFYHEGRRVTWTKRSHQRGEIGESHLIRQQLKVNDNQLRGLVDCSVSRNDYVEILREKGLIPSP